MHLLSFMVLARLLAPDDFGKIALFTSMLALFQAVTEMSGGAFLVRTKNPTKADFDTVWTVGLIRAVVVASLLAPTTLVYTAYIAKPEYSIIGFTLCLCTILLGAQNTYFAIYEKAVNFSPAVRQTLWSIGSAAVVSVVAAVYWRDFRALLAGQLTSALITLAYSHLAVSKTPRFSLASWRRLYDFAIWLMVSNVLVSVGNRLDALILSRLIGDHNAGLYVVARNATAPATSDLVGPVGQVLFTGLAEKRANRDEVKRLHLRSLSIVCVVVMPLAVGLALVAPDMVPVLFGPGWQGAVFPIQVIAVNAALQLTCANFRAVFLAVGSTKAFMWRCALYAPVRLCAFIYGTIEYGLAGAVVGFFLADACRAVLDNIMLSRLLKLAPAQIWRAFWRTIPAILGMVAVCFFVSGVIPSTDDFARHLYRLIAIVLTGAVVYVSIVLALWRFSGCPAGGESTTIALCARWWSRNVSRAGSQSGL